MTTNRIDALLAMMTPEEIHEGLWFIELMERWNMPRNEANEWRRRIMGMQAFLGLKGVQDLVN